VDSISRGDWERVKRVAAEAWVQSPGARTAFVLEACSGDETLRTEVLSLLESMEQVGDRFETPALAMASSRRAAADALHAAVIDPGERIGGWTVLRLIGSGGMGTVYLAERVGDEFSQRAAIKIVRGAADAILLRRFQEERRILATLDHPHIARLIDGGASDRGLPYVAMEYVDGQPIDVFCEEGGLDVRKRLEVFRLVCLAVHYAHQHLVIHRDLKASNILVTADGTPKLLDFGIAKILEPDSPGETTRTLFRVLTPESASPEQIRGEPITTATDVYALGVLLYRLITGRSPYRLDMPTHAEMSRAVSPLSSISRTDAGIGVLPPEGEDRVAEPLHARRLDTELPRAGGPCRHLVLFPVGLAEDEDGDRAKMIVAGDPAQHRGRVHVGQVEVEDDEGGPWRLGEWRTPLQEGQGVGAALHGVDRERVLEDRPRDAEEALVVVDHEHGDGGAAHLSTLARRAGAP